MRKRLKARRQLAEEKDCMLVDDPALVNETAGLVEWPVPLLGRIDDAFMDVPDEVLTSVMRTHQKYFSLKNPITNKLAPYFMTIAIIETADQGAAIIAGNARVLRARLSDGQFYGIRIAKHHLKPGCLLWKKSCFMPGSARWRKKPCGWKSWPLS